MSVKPCLSTCSHPYAADKEPMKTTACPMTWYWWFFQIKRSDMLPFEMQEENHEERVQSYFSKLMGHDGCAASMEAQNQRRLQIELRMRIYSTENTEQPCGRSCRKDRDIVRAETYQQLREGHRTF